MNLNLKLPNIKKGKYQKVIEGKKSQCLTCERKCKIDNKELGYCGTRINISGGIYSLIYGYIPAISVNPIEKKPFYHFFPGTYALTVGSYGCNFNCFWCQNHHLSHPQGQIKEIINKKDSFISPEDLINTAISKGCDGTSISFNEPTLLFEYAIEIFKRAKKKDLYNTFVSNGYMTEEVLRDLVNNGLDAINIDIKGNNKQVKKYCGINNEIVWRNASLAKKLGVHVEITTLVIEGLNSNMKIINEITRRIRKELGSNTPYHISRFFPRYKSNVKGFQNDTSLKVLQKSYKVALNNLNHVYVGNIFDSKYITTYCPNCSKPLIERYGLGVRENNLDTESNCSFCGKDIDIIS